MLINSEDKSQPAAGDDSPSQLLGAFIGYLRSRTTNGDSESTGLDESGSEPEGVLRDVCEIGGVPAITLQPQVGRPDRTVLYFHGGGYVSGSPPDRYLALGRQRWRWPPTPACTSWTTGSPRKHPSPAPSTTAWRAYRWLISDGRTDPRTLAVLGDSAGGNLAVAVTAAARDQGLPLPASVAIISPFADLTFSGASIEQRKDMDPYVSHELLESMAADYMGDSDRSDPRSSVSSPICTDSPLLIQVGENEILYDDATRIRDAPAPRVSR